MSRLVGFRILDVEDVGSGFCESVRSRELG